MGWLRRWAWAKGKPLLWANLGLITMSVLLIFLWPGPSDLRLRTWGLLLQLIGVATVALDLTRTAGRFGKGGFVRHPVAWLRAYFRLGIIVGGVGTAQGAGELHARGKVRHSNPQDALLPDRVATLEANVQKIDDDLDAAYREIDQRAHELDAKINAESAKRDAAIGEVNKRVEEAATDNLGTLAFGVVWLAIGVMLATLAPEIVRLAGGQWCEVWQAL